MNRREFHRLAGLATGMFALVPVTMHDLSPTFESHQKSQNADPFKHLRGEPPVHAEIRTERGGARLFLNNKEVYPFWGTSLHLLATISNFRDSHIRLIHPVLGLGSGWRGPEKYDWTLFDSFLSRLLELHPDAYFLPRLQLDTPEWWKDAHPDELIAYGLPAKEEHLVMLAEKEALFEGGYHSRAGAVLREASFASTVWREDTSAMLRAFLQHIEESPLRSRMMGYHPTTGRTAEWNYFGEMYLPDYSAPMVRAVGDVPDTEARIRSTYGLLRNPEKEHKVMRFYTLYHEIIAETVLTICRTIKEATHGRVLCGVFYGYVTEQPRIQEGGYLAAEKVLNSPHIDYIASPYTYQPGNATDERGVRVTMVDGAGNKLGHARGVAGDGAYRLPIESMRRRKKLFVAEMDPSTYRDTKAHAVVGGHGGLGSGTLEGSLRILRRDIGGVLAQGVGGWLFDFGPLNNAPEGWYSGEPLLNEIRRLIDLGAHRPELDISREGEMAVLFDQQSFTATAHWLAGKPWEQYGIKSTDYFNHWFVNTQMRAFLRMGAPLDSLFRFDLTKEDAVHYRMLFVVNTFLLSAQEREELQSALRGSGCTVVWYYAPGFLTPERLDLRQMEQLTGFRFSVRETPAPMLIRMAQTGGAAAQVRSFGVDEQHFPRFVVADKNVEVLGEWADGAGPAFARTRHEGYTSIYVGTAPVPADVLRALAQEAGVRMWSTKQDIVFSTHDAAMLVATDAGERTLTFPRPLVRLATGERSAAHNLELETGEVEIFAAR